MVLMSTKQEIAFAGYAMLLRASNGLNPLLFCTFTLLEFRRVLFIQSGYLLRRGQGFLLGKSERFAVKIGKLLLGFAQTDSLTVAACFVLFSLSSVALCG